MEMDRSNKKPLMWGITAVIALALAFSLLFGLGHIGKRTNQEQIIGMAQNMNLHELAKVLKKQDIINSEIGFYLWVKFFADYKKFQAGKYRFASTDYSFASIAQMMSSGEVFHELTLSFTIPEGFSKSQVFERISQVAEIPVLELETLAKDPVFIGELGLPSIANLEGYLYPSTYLFYDEKPTAKIILKTMVRELQKKLSVDLLNQFKERDLTLHKAIILASLIEKETSLEEEKTMIAEVIWNRLKRKETLGIDAAIIYGIADYSGNLTSKHLKDKKNKYNLRVYPGLPPGPICSPAISSLEALVKPTNFGYFFYVLKPGSSKEHTFSRSIKEHTNAVRKLVHFQTRGRKN